MLGLLKHSTQYISRYSSFIKKSVTKYKSCHRYVTDVSRHVQSKTSHGEIIFKYENSRFFLMSNVFGIMQCGMVLYISVPLLKGINELIDDNNELSPLVFKKDYKINEKKLKKGCVLVLVLMSVTVLGVTALYSLRSVKAIAILKDQTVAVVTYSPFARHRVIKVPLENIGGLRGRNPNTTYCQLKIKGFPLNFLVDMRGKFENLKAFDTLINVRRNFY